MTYTPEELREAGDEIWKETGFRAESGGATHILMESMFVISWWALVRERIRAKRAEGKLARARGLLREVINYRKGNGKYDFSRVPSEERQNYVLGAWIDLELEITAALKELEEGK